jgi:hypothetical protein
VARDGTVFFSDYGNNRVRAVLPDGTIKTVAGDGRTGGFLIGSRPVLRVRCAPRPA